MCREIADLHPAKVVYGPGTFINTAVNQIHDQLSKQARQSSAQAQQAAEPPGGFEAARRPACRAAPAGRRGVKAVQAKFVSDTLRLALSYGSAARRDQRPGFVSALVFDRTTGSRACRSRASRTCSLEERRPDPDPAAARPLRRGAAARDRPDPDGDGGEGVPAREGREVHRDRRAGGGGRAGRRRASAIFVLLGAALLLMAATLALVFNARLRLLPLALALAAAAHDVRRAVDRGRRPDDGVDRGAAGSDRARGGLRDPVPGALQRGGGERGEPEPAVAAVTAGGPTILTAGLATAIGFLVLLLSPVPMVRGFGALLVVGIVIALPARCARASRR